MVGYLSLVLILSFIASVLVTRYWIYIALRYQILDHPNSRGSHLQVTPRGGGVAILAVSLSGILVQSYLGVLDFSPLVIVLFLGGLAIGLLGMLDDIVSLRARSKFLIQLIVALGAVYLLPDLPQLPMVNLVDWPLWLAYALAVFSIVWSINLFNFMDGINGLAGSEAVFVLLGAVLILSLTGQFYDLSLILLIAGSVLGFLVFNFPRAKVFMGDSGSCFLGYVIAILALGSSESDSISPWSWVILYGVFVVDTSVTLVVRLATGQKWYQPHNLHAYQKNAKGQRSHARVTGSITLVNIFWCLPLAILGTIYSDYSLFIVVVALAPIVLWVLKFNPGLS